MKGLIQVFAGLAVLGWAGAASADGMNPSRAAPMDLPAADCCQARWGGLYIGASVGVGIADTAFREDHDNINLGTGSNYHDLASAGVTGTVAVGYDRQLHGNMVVGVFVDYTFGELDSTFSLDVSPFPQQRVNLAYDDTWAVGGRLGFARSCCTLWFATAGYTRTTADFGDFVKKDLDGYFVGLGVEQQIRDRLTLKLEYRFSDYGRTTIFSDSGACCSQTIDIDTHVHAIRLGLTYKLDFHREHDPMK